MLFGISPYLLVHFKPELFNKKHCRSQQNISVYIPLLSALFFHRYMLRRLGLWKGKDDMFEAPVPLIQINSSTNTNLSDTSPNNVYFSFMKHGRLF